MTAISVPQPLRSLAQRFQRSWQRLFAPTDVIYIIIVTVMLVMPALALEAADWPLDMRVVIPVLLLSVVFGFLLARSHYNELLALIISGIYGGSFVLLIAGANEPGTIVGGVSSVLFRSIRWLVDATTGGINQDNLVFTLLVATLFWYLGYNAVWHIFRIDRIWRVILPPGLILVTNMVIYNGPANLEIYLVIYVFTSLLLVVRSNLDNRQWDWYVNGIRAPRHLAHQFIQVGAVLSLVSLLAAWNIPSGDLDERLARFQEFLRSDPVMQFSEYWNRLVEPIESEGPATTDYYGGDSLNLGGAVRLGEQVVLLVNAPRNGLRYYWRARVFERYDQGRWAPSAELRVPDLNPPLEIHMAEPVIGGARVPVQQTFTVAMPATRLIHAAPQLSQVNLSGRSDVRYVDNNSPQSMNISVVRPVNVISRGESYNVTSLMSVATADQLRAASTDYPDWVTNPNLYVGLSTSGRVIQLAQNIVAEAGAVTPYDQAKAIESWLRQNIAYNEQISAPPPGVDPVEWVLFDIRQGYCTYYATSMIVMLRSLGIPARMAAGFAQGEYVADSDQFVVRERDAHTWVEVYFPGYGWVEFEPTSAQAPINRDGDQAFQEEQQPVEPVASDTPTSTPTLTPSPLPTATPENQLTPQQQQPDAIPTITTTPSPTPTATPVIVPTVAPPIQPPPSGDFLSFLLPAIGLAFLVLFVIVLIVLAGVFIYWWWEWRGMGGLSPIARAYARLERYIALIGLRTSDRQTPEEKRRVIVRQIPQAEKPVTAITRFYMTETYGQPNNDPNENVRRTQIMDRAWNNTRENILKRWLRRLLPWSRE